MARLAPVVVLLFAVLAAPLVLGATVVPNEVQQPGTQPGEVSNLESPNKCDNCHGGYNTAVEPAWNWRGSMMAHAGRDPIFWATLAITEQDFDGAGDLCLRCHSTGGWLAGRSTPTDGSGLAAGDSDGVECDFCHKLTNPDDSEHQGVMNAPFIANDPGSGEGYYGSGMSSLWPGADKLGPYNNAEARHQFMQSQFHRDRNFCGSCHDVSNPVTGDLAHNAGAQFNPSAPVHSGVPGSALAGKAAFNNPPYRYGVVERTFSEYWSSAISGILVDEYPSKLASLQGGALQAIYQASYDPARGTANYEDGTPRYYACQACHMRAVKGTGANKNGVPLRSDLPLHDMTGGNYWMADAIIWLDDRGLLRLGGGMTTLQRQALLDGAARARQQLQLAATLELEDDEVYVINHTGHKLITGYPEGRRMWLNVRWYNAADALLREDGAYGALPGVTANGQQVHSLLDLHDPNTVVYEAHMGMTQAWAAQLLGLGYPTGLELAYDRVSGEATLTLGQLAGAAPGSTAETFHFALNNVVVADNRIPPFGMRYDEAQRRNASPMPQSQYDGAPGGIYDNYDEVQLHPPAGAVRADIRLMYQPTSWEYIQFLDQANDGGSPFLGNEGANMLAAWLATGMAEPFAMATASWQGSSSCSLAAPTLLDAQAAHEQVTLQWSGPAAAERYRLYYDQAGKAQLVTELDCGAGLCLQYSDTGLTNGQTYCYKVTAATVSCESGFSNIGCATPQTSGHQLTAGAAILETGRWVKSGRSRNRYPVYETTTEFVQGDEIVFKLLVTDSAGAPLPDARVSLAVSGPESADLVSTTTAADGTAEVLWQTKQPDKIGLGGTATGAYEAAVSGLSSATHNWDGAVDSVDFAVFP